MRFRFVEAEKAHYPIRLICRCLAVSRSGYYAWRKRPPSARARNDSRLRVEIAASHSASRRTYGSPRILHDLRAEGHRVSRKRVARLMRELGLVGRRKRRFRATTDSKHRFPVAPNVLMRDFEVAEPNIAWATDITYIATLEGWLYLAAILDLFSRRVVGYALSERIDRALVLEALREALERRPDTRDLIHHSDRGSQYASHDYREALEHAGITCSMSRRGDCWDNAVVESFFGTLKTELLYELPLQTRDATRGAVADYIDAFYNVRRRHSSLDYQSPVEFELKKGKGLGGSAPEPVRPTAHDISGVQVLTRAEALRPGIRTRLRSREATWRAGGGERMARRRTNAIRPHDQASWRVQAKPTLRLSGRQRASRWVAGQGVRDGHEVVGGGTSGR